jgi:hypothetical protein
MANFTSHRVYSDIFGLEYVVQHTAIKQTKNILIDTLREVFRQDREYKYVDSCFGFPLTPSHLGLDPDAGLDDEETTRIFIGSAYRYDIKFNPSIIVRNASTKYVPISFNQDMGSVIYTTERVVDAYGVESIVSTPAHHTLVGAWDQTLEVKVISENGVDREEIADIVLVTLQSTRRTELQNEGVFIKSVSTGGEQERAYSNDHLYMLSINVDVRSEFKIHIPINDVCERIALYITLDNFTTSDVDNDMDILSTITSSS